MLPSDCQFSLQALPLSVLMVGFHEPDFSPACHAVLTSMKPQASVDWVTTVENGMARIAAGNRYDVVVVDCRKGGGMWEAISHLQKDGQKAAILGIMSVAEKASAQAKIAEDAIGYRVD
ncbi:MAG: hypothetical protein E4H32_09345 [Nitrospirales bacterium]|nr:MAG: hypothetical protein E4H32_09345 [Nitrospirales bacterium]